MARIDDLQLDPEQGPGHRSAAVQQFLDELETLRASGWADWADETLKGIYDTVSGSNRVTDGQRGAVDNIRASAESRADVRPGARRGGSRRYEGHNRPSPWEKW